MAQPDTIVLIHGLWMTPRSWEAWAARYEERGFKVLAPAWPGMEAEVEELNRDPSPIAVLDALRVVEHYDRIIRALPRQPIIMGHSFGGTFAAAARPRSGRRRESGIASSTVKGVFDLPLSTIRATAPPCVTRSAEAGRRRSPPSSSTTRSPTR